MIYYALVEKDAGSAYGVRFPDLPGCFSAADEEGDVVANVQVALALYADGEHELPVPRSIEALRRDEDVRAALADGAFLLAVPLVITGRKVRTNVMIDKCLLETIDREAKATGISRSEYLAQASKEKLRASGAVLISREGTNGKPSSAPKRPGNRFKGRARGGIAVGGKKPGGSAA